MIRTWNAGSGQLLLEWQGPAEPLHDLAYDPAGSFLASVSGGGTVTFWDPSTGQRQHSLDVEVGAAHRIAFSPCGTWLAVGAREGRVQVFDTHSRQRKHDMSLKSRLSGMAFGRGGHLAVIAENASVVCWDAATGQTIWSLPSTGVRRQADLAFHPEGTRLALAIGGDAVTLWDLPHKQQFFALRQRPDVAGLVAFSPDGTYLAAATGDGSICVWVSSTSSVDDAVGPER
jgi:WD40 repeat protein